MADPVPYERWAAAGTLAVMLAVPAAFDPAYGYYGLLRLCVTAGAVWFGLAELARGRRLLAVAMFAAALLFNPVWSPEFERDEWRVIDGWLALAFGIYAAWLSPLSAILACRFADRRLLRRDPDDLTPADPGFRLWQFSVAAFVLFWIVAYNVFPPAGTSLPSIEALVPATMALGVSIAGVMVQSRRNRGYLSSYVAPAAAGLGLVLLISHGVRLAEPSVITENIVVTDLNATDVTMDDTVSDPYANALYVEGRNAQYEREGAALVAELERQRAADCVDGVTSSGERCASSASAGLETPNNGSERGSNE